MEGPFLTPDLLAKRWKISPKTLSQWRWRGRGPNYYKVEGRIMYWLPDIEDCEYLGPSPNTVPVVPLVQKIPRLIPDPFSLPSLKLPATQNLSARRI